MVTPHQVLQHYFGYSEFRPGQTVIIESIINGQDTLALMPTGGGKSLCFQVPGLVLGGTTLVISPLISLMKDQVDTLVRKGITATFLNSSMSREKLVEQIHHFAQGKYQFVYCAPERLTNPQFIAACQKIHLPLIAIDEAHCISQWGHDFRPEYWHIATFIKQLPKRPVVAAFTATATSRVQKDILTSLTIPTAQVFSRSFKRTNLTLSVLHCQDTFAKHFYLHYLLKKHVGMTGIVYTTTRHAADEVAQSLRELDFAQERRVGCYHGGMSGEERSRIQELFLTDQLNLIVATNAFGMGVDKSNIRFVIHYQPAANLENYYQEAGRAGRDGQESWCYLLFQPEDLTIHRNFIQATHTNPTHPQHRLNLKRLAAVFAYATLSSCRTHFILNYFDERPEQGACQKCDFCLKQKIHPTSLEKKHYLQINAFRKWLAKKNSVPAQHILTVKLMHLLLLHQPRTIEHFLTLPGIGPGWIEKYYQPVADFLITLTTDRAGHL
jgi:ATP-dependent DNA helicase RecQ